MSSKLTVSTLPLFFSRMVSVPFAESEETSSSSGFIRTISSAALTAAAFGFFSMSSAKLFALPPSQLRPMKVATAQPPMTTSNATRQPMATLAPVESPFLAGAIGSLMGWLREQKRGTRD
jgi:hypothetical protein